MLLDRFQQTASASSVAKPNLTVSCHLLQQALRQSQAAPVALLAFFDQTTGFLTLPCGTKPSPGHERTLYRFMDLSHETGLPLLAIPATENFEEALKRAIADLQISARSANALKPART